MGFEEARTFLLASYHDLPNILFVGSLMLGALMGYLPLVWVAFGLILNGITVSFVQAIFILAFKAYASQTGKDASWVEKVLYSDASSSACTVGFQRVRSMVDKTSSGSYPVVPSHWMAAAAFFAIFSIYNSIRVTARESAPNTDSNKVDTRRAFSISALIIGVVFLAVILLRFTTECETKLGGSLGILVGGGMGIGFWHILDACGTGKIPDILQVVGSMAPKAGEKPTTPVMCMPSDKKVDYE